MKLPRAALKVLPVRGIGEVRAGDDLAALITTAAPWLRDGDVLVVTSKIVSKAEGRLVEVPPEAGPLRDSVRDEVLAAETARLVASRGGTRIVQTHHGFVMASAGIDASNVDRTRLVLLPKDPDSSARGLRSALRERAGLDVAVIISDTMGRPWRNGLTDVALGAAGIDALLDYRGVTDPYGNVLHLTQMAVADELAGAAELVKGKCDQVPVAVVRGYLATTGGQGGAGTGRPDGAGAAALVREASQDLFSLGTAEARAAGMRDAARLANMHRPAANASAVRAPAAELEVDPQAVARAIDLIRPVLGTRTRLVPATGPARVLCGLACPADRPAIDQSPTDQSLTDPYALIHLGADIHRLRAALAADGIASVLRPGVGSFLAILELSQRPGQLTCRRARRAP